MSRSDQRDRQGRDGADAPGGASPRPEPGTGSAGRGAGLRLEGRIRMLSGPSPDLSPARTFAPSACILTVAVGHYRWNEGCERHPHRGDILGDREHAVRTSPGQRACARRRWCSSLSGLVGCEVVEEGDHAGPELLGGQGVGLRGAAQAHVGEERVVRGRLPLWLIHAADCCSRYSLCTCCGSVLKSGADALNCTRIHVPHNVPARMFTGRILGAVDAFVLKRGEERLGHRIIVADPGAADGLPEIMHLQRLSDSQDV